jgi:hypothetical protein
MPGKFSELEAKMSPERRSRINEEVKKTLAEMPIRELRNARDLLAGKLELYTLIDEGLAQVKEGCVKPMKGTIKNIREKIPYCSNCTSRPCSRSIL